MGYFLCWIRLKLLKCSYRINKKRNSEIHLVGEGGGGECVEMREVIRVSLLCVHGYEYVDMSFHQNCIIFNRESKFM